MSFFRVVFLVETCFSIIETDVSMSFYEWLIWLYTFLFLLKAMGAEFGICAEKS